MENNKKTNLSEEHLRKIKHRFGYTINESAKYRPLVSANEEFDEVPTKLTNEAGEHDAPEEIPVAPTKPVDANVGMDAPAPPEGGEAGTAPVPPPAEGSVPPPPDNLAGGPNAADPMGAPVAPIEPPQPDVNDIQNEIIKHNIEAMRSIHDQLEGLNSTVQGLNSKLEILNADVAEVREPTNSEKLMNKTKVSYPYYFNLNDLWSGNWFDGQGGTEKGEEKGIKELPDGTYVADFDDLPQRSKTDVQNSFNDIV